VGEANVGLGLGRHNNTTNSSTCVFGLGCGFGFRARVRVRHARVFLNQSSVDEIVSTVCVRISACRYCRNSALAPRPPPASDSAPGNRPKCPSPHRDGKCSVPHRVLVHFWTIADLRCGLWPPGTPKSPTVSQNPGKLSRSC